MRENERKTTIFHFVSENWKQFFSYVNAVGEKNIEAITAIRKDSHVEIVGRIMVKKLDINNLKQIPGYNKITQSLKEMKKLDRRL